MSLKEDIFHYNAYLVVHCNSYCNFFFIKIYVYVCCFVLLLVMKSPNKTVNVGVLTISSNIFVTV